MCILSKKYEPSSNEGQSSQFTVDSDERAFLDLVLDFGEDVFKIRVNNIDHRG